MQGIFGNTRNLGFLPSPEDDSILGPQRGAAPSGVLGGGNSTADLTDDQRRRLLFAGIADAFDSVRGIDGNTSALVSQGFQKQNERQRRLDANKAVQAAYATGDMNAVRQALMAADPADVAHITDAISFGQPKYQDVGGGLYQIDPFGQDAPKQVIAPAASNTPHEGINPLTGKPGQYLLNGGKPQWLDVGVLPKAPQTRTIQRGMQTVTQEFTPDGQWRDVPGAIGPRFKPDTPKPTGSGGTFGNPASLFGGR